MSYATSLRSMLLTAVLGACGSGVCMGCGGDDASDDVPDDFRVVTVPVDRYCDGDSEALTVEFWNVRSGAPIVRPKSVPLDVCDAVEDRGDAWFVHCESNPGIVFVRDIEIVKTLDGGAYTVGPRPQPCSDEIVIPVASLELLDGEPPP